MASVTVHVIRKIEENASSVAGGYCDTTSDEIVIRPNTARSVIFSYVSGNMSPAAIVRYDFRNENGRITSLYYEYVWNESKIKWVFFF